MLTLFHAPHSRSTRIIALLEELGALDKVKVELVSIPRQDGTGARDLRNPHPEGKVPVLAHDGVAIWETPAIMLYLTDLFPEAGLGPQVGDPLRGRYLSYLSWYGDVVEPVMIFAAARLQHPYLTATFRGMPELVARLETALRDQPYLLGERFSAADLLLFSPFAWFRDMAPDVQAIKDWIARCDDRPALARAAAFDAQALAA